MDVSRGRDSSLVSDRRRAAAKISCQPMQDVGMKIRGSEFVKKEVVVDQVERLRNVDCGD